MGDYVVGKTSLLKRVAGESFHEQPSSTNESKGVGREKSYTLYSHSGNSVVVRGMIGQVQKKKQKIIAIVVS